MSKQWKNPFPFEKRQEIHEFEQQPIVANDILNKFEITKTVLSKPKRITTKQILDEKARKHKLEKAKERASKTAAKKAHLEEKLQENNEKKKLLEHKKKSMKFFNYK